MLTLERGGVKENRSCYSRTLDLDTFVSSTILIERMLFFPNIFCLLGIVAEHDVPVLHCVREGTQ